MHAIQRERILTLLSSGDWVSLTTILDLRIASHTKRISELRRMGYTVEKKEAYRGRQRLVWYRLLGDGSLF